MYVFINISMMAHMHFKVKFPQINFSRVPKHSVLSSLQVIYNWHYNRLRRSEI